MKKFILAMLMFVGFVGVASANHCNVQQFRTFGRSYSNRQIVREVIIEEVPEVVEIVRERYVSVPVFQFRQFYGNNVSRFQSNIVVERRFFGVGHNHRNFRNFRNFSGRGHR